MRWRSNFILLSFMWIASCPSNCPPLYWFIIPYHLYTNVIFVDLFPFTLFCLTLSIHALTTHLFFFFFFLPHPGHMEVPVPEIRSELQLQPVPQLGNPRTLTHCTGPEIKTTLSQIQRWILNLLHHSRNSNV